MKIGDQDSELIIDLLRASTTSREKALALLEAICRTAYSEGLCAGSRATGDLLNKTFDAMLGTERRQ